MKRICIEIIEWSFLFLQACFCLLAVLTCPIWMPLLMYVGAADESSQYYNDYDGAFRRN